MESAHFLKLIYTFFLGVLLALFVGFGINTFYAPPPAPEYPVEYNTYGKEPTQEQLVKQREFEAKMAQHDKAMRPYSRNVSMIALVAAVILLAVSIVFESRMKVISDGVMLGGLFVLLYSIGRGFASADSKYGFIETTVVLIIVLYLGYDRFVRGHGSTKA